MIYALKCKKCGFEYIAADSTLDDIRKMVHNTKCVMCGGKMEVEHKNG